MSVFPLLLLFGVIVIDTSNGGTVHDYLDEKLKLSKVEIAKIRIQDDPPVEVKSYKLQTEKLWHQSLSNHQAFLANALNAVLVVENDRLFILGDKVPLSNETSVLREIVTIPVDNAIKFIRTIVWKSVLYLLICHVTGSCSLYTSLSDNLELRHRQTIRQRGAGFPVDGCFFTRENQLYLVVADNSGEFTVPSVIYDWRGTYMDMVTEMFTTGAVSVATFKHKSSTILVFAQNGGNNPRVGSLVYEFKDNTAQKIQFLPTIDPLSVHHYNYGGFDFVLLANRNLPGELFWWDGQELLRWMTLPEFEASSFNQIESFNEQTYFFVVQSNTIQLYKVQTALDCTLVGSLKLKGGETVVDMRVLQDKSTIKAILVLKNEGNAYSLESWELLIEEASHGSRSLEKDAASKCLAELIEILSRRMPSVQQASSSWSALYPASEDLTLSTAISLPKLDLNSGLIDSINLLTPQEIIAPARIGKDIQDLVKEVEDVLAASEDVPAPNRTNFLRGNIVVQGDVFFEELHIDSMDVDFWNDVDLRTHGATAARSAGQSSKTLRGKSIVVEDLEVDSLCGIPSNFWARKNDTSRIPLNTTTTKVEVRNGTLLVDADVSLPDLKVDRLNDVDVHGFFDDVFILGAGQIINGNITYTKPVKIMNLTAQFFNDVPAKYLMDKTSDQSFDEFYVKTIKIDKLYAESVNGVPVNESARISRANVVKGEVNLATLRVTEELILDAPTESENTEYLQVYKNVTIEGNLKVKSIDIKHPAITSINNEQFDLQKLPYWTKSSNQIVPGKVRFAKNLMIDRLTADYINEIPRQEFLYTNLKEMPVSLLGLHFDHLHIDDSFLSEDGNSSLIEFTEDTLTFRKEWGIDRLRVDDLSVNLYNGIPVNVSLTNGTQLAFAGSRNYPVINAKRVKVTELHFDHLNGKSAGPFEKVQPRTNESQRIQFIRLPELEVEVLDVENINGADALKLRSFGTEAERLFKDLILHGDLTVKNDLVIGQIEDRSVESYLEELVNEDLVISSEEEFENLTVGTATFNLLHGRSADNFFRDVLSKEMEQCIPGNISFHRITTTNISTDYVNKQATSTLIWVDRAITINGNVTFDELSVEGDVITEELNGREPSELYDSLLTIPMKSISLLEVDGKISWSNSLKGRNSISYFLENAVAKDSEEVIHGDVTFENGVSVSVLKGNLQEEDAIRRVLLDAVTDDKEATIITGKKIFKGNLIADELSVANYVNISTINNVNIVDFNASIIRKYMDNEISNHLTFLDEVIVNELRMGDHVHGAPMNKIALQTDQIASNVVFDHLEVLQNVYVKYLDGINLDTFLKRRITLDGNSTILSDVQFNGPVEVTGNVEVSKINGANPADFVLNGTEETQFISGSKTFENDLVITGNARAPLINGINVTSEWKNGIRNDDDVEIHGDLTLEGKVQAKHVFVSEFVNGVDSRYLSNNSEHHVSPDLDTRQQSQSVEKDLQDLFKASSTLRNKFVYLEEEKSLSIRLPNVKNVESTYYEGVVKLNIFGEEVGSVCGLAPNCSCPVEYMAEYTEEDCDIKKSNDSVRAWHFHVPHSAIAITIESNTVSYSLECSLKEDREEFTRISWMRIEISSTGDTIGIGQDIPVKIKGFVKDTQIFMIDNEAYIVLAIYYDPALKSHRTKSLIYKLNFETNSLTLYQEVLSDGASDIEVFYVDYNAYLLIACSGVSSRSHLYRFDPIVSQFILVRNFPGKSQHAKSLSQGKDHFVFLDDSGTRSVKVFSYRPQSLSFHSYQNLFYDSKVQGIECFHADAIGDSDSFVIVSTQSGEFFVYEYMFAQGFVLVMNAWIDGGQTMHPFYYSGQHYLLAGTTSNSTILRIVQEGPRP